ncbi:DUF4913 domain-containing protein [Rathayibacter tritici]|uniref:DUF4913 domain-containing protein n=1 Tax=Rathayibacter tritici TaxID=33888 RepID=UPI000CE88DE3|nr:DUF4913 domain-containing protein [Rathayibacter tritici]PPF28036.1 DUF4913 domain-containing protein [Rathayibacter tritici]PPF66171.1 DUF4913 domain-containing protein [Rathayibacter tritici]PPG05965.1 DUF4913 domain-containing protein [Rathayibacter tritici]PPI10679.1 DUF4913 domain-containing protein [Rathayibacter tritici]PPI47051.1 DUF4913 domain-containing protein [Rathayibacter tritici]
MSDTTTLPATAAAGEDEQQSLLYYGSVDEFFRKFLWPSYRRKVGSEKDHAPHRWSATWWSNSEARARLTAIWHLWEAAREAPLDLSAWWLVHVDPQMRMLLSTDGPFATSIDTNDRGGLLPYKRPPAGFFPTDRQGPIPVSEYPAPVIVRDY